MNEVCNASSDWLKQNQVLLSGGAVSLENLNLIYFLMIEIQAMTIYQIFL